MGGRKRNLENLQGLAHQQSVQMSSSQPSPALLNIYGNV